MGTHRSITVSAGTHRRLDAARRELAYDLDRNLSLDATIERALDALAAAGQINLDPETAEADT